MSRAVVHCHLSRILAAHGIKPKRFEEATGYSQTQVSRICCGHTTPLISTALCVLPALVALGCFKADGRPYELSDVWTLATQRRFPRPPSMQATLDMLAARRVAA